MNVQNNGFLSLEQVQNKYLNPDRQAKNDVSVSKSGMASFQDILSQKTKETAGEVKFSRHAANRLADRNIELSDEQVKRLNLGMERAGEKGINESLVIVDSLAFIVNIPNQTVITAMDRQDSDENVFTNIDGAVII